MPGAQWELGAVGNAEWTGVPLATLLDRAGLTGKACDVVLEGADRGQPVEPPIPPEPISYSRSVPLDKALADVLIAYAMNSADLPLDHGPHQSNAAPEVQPQAGGGAELGSGQRSISSSAATCSDRPPEKGVANGLVDVAEHR